MVPRISVCVFVLIFVSELFAQVDQTSPERMTGKLLVNGRDVGSAFLVGDNGHKAAILSAAHCVPGDLRQSGVEIVFIPGAYRDRFGVVQAPYGRFVCGQTIRMNQEWFKYKDCVEGDDYLTRARMDFVVLELNRSPRLGYFAVTTGEPNVALFTAGYAKIANGRLWKGVAEQPEFFDSWMFRCNGPVPKELKGASGGPFYFRNAQGRLIAFAIHTGVGLADDPRQGHRRITAEVVEQIRGVFGWSGSNRLATTR